jgi:regulator of protease activity HflC (stomatin/prohibitin superfamily)
MARQMKAEREKRANILDAEGLRQSEILRAEGEKQAVILDAEGKKEGAFREAEARERLAEAEAKATKMISEAINNGDPKALSYFLGQKYIEALQGIVTSPNEKLLMLPMDTSQVMGTIAGISELVNDTLKSKLKKQSKEQK